MPMRVGLPGVAAVLLVGAGCARNPPLVLTPADLAPGDRIRVTTVCPPPRRHENCGSHTGALLALTPDSLHLRAAPGSDSMAVPLDIVGGLKVARGRTSAVQSGAIAGAAAGLVVGIAAGLSGECADYEGTLPCVPPEPFLGPLVGGAIGALIGLNIHRDRWVRVSLPPRPDPRRPGSDVPPLPQRQSPRRAPVPRARLGDRDDGSSNATPSSSGCRPGSLRPLPCSRRRRRG